MARWMFAIALLLVSAATADKPRSLTPKMLESIFNIPASTDGNNKEDKNRLLLGSRQLRSSDSRLLNVVQDMKLQQEKDGTNVLARLHSGSTIPAPFGEDVQGEGPDLQPALKVQTVQDFDNFVTNLQDLTVQNSNGEEGGEEQGVDNEEEVVVGSEEDSEEEEEDTSGIVQGGNRKRSNDWSSDDRRYLKARSISKDGGVRSPPYSESKASTKSTPSDKASARSSTNTESEFASQVAQQQQQPPPTTTSLSTTTTTKKKNNTNTTVSVDLPSFQLLFGVSTTQDPMNKMDILRVTRQHLTNQFHSSHPNTFYHLEVFQLVRDGAVESASMTMVAFGGTAYFAPHQMTPDALKDATLLAFLGQNKTDYMVGLETAGIAVETATLYTLDGSMVMYQNGTMEMVSNNDDDDTDDDELLDTMGMMGSMTMIAVAVGVPGTVVAMICFAYVWWQLHSRYDCGCCCRGRKGINPTGEVWINPNATMASTTMESSSKKKKKKKTSAVFYDEDEHDDDDDKEEPIPPELQQTGRRWGRSSSYSMA